MTIVVCRCKRTRVIAPFKNSRVVHQHICSGCREDAERINASMSRLVSVASPVRLFSALLKRVQSNTRG